MKINDCMQAACNQSVSVCIGVRSLVKSSLDLRYSFFFFCCVPLPQYGDKYAHYRRNYMWQMDIDINYDGTFTAALAYENDMRFSIQTL